MTNTPQKILDELNSLGFTHATGVPDTIMKNFILCLDNDKRFKHFIANREGEAVAIASGAYLANKKCFVYMQNMGIGDITNCILSLNNLSQIPLLLFISWRGEKGKDSIETIETGLKTENMLAKLGLKLYKFDKNKIPALIEMVNESVEKNRKCTAILVSWGDLD